MTMHDYGCDSYHLSRRRFMQAGAATFGTLMGMSIRDLVAMADQRAPTGKARADHVVLLWMAGGMSHLDTWDPKPGQPTAGELGAIDTSVPGIRVGEILPKTAKQIHHAALIRSLSGVEGDHGRATYNVLTSYREQPQFVHPAIGSVIAHELQPQGDLPTYITIGGRAPGAGYLGQKAEAYYIGRAGEPDPYVQMPEDITAVRAERRLEILKKINREYASKLPGHEDLETTEESYDAAVTFMHSPALKAFDLEKENPATRAAYGDTNFGRGCLLARRLVEQGVRFVQVNMGGFDTHANNFPAMRNLGAVVDPALASLVGDLAAAGKLDRTLILMLSEFGRTPNINDAGGRDHYPRVFSCFMAGGGVKPGTVYGSSDPQGREVADKKVHVGDVHATVCHQLGIDPKKYVKTPIGRPMRLVDDGEPIADLVTG